VLLLALIQPIKSTTLTELAIIWTEYRFILIFGWPVSQDYHEQSNPTNWNDHSD
jgi:hypothetical protein